MLLAYEPYRSHKDSEDNRLWAELRSGRQAALEELFLRHHKHLYNYGIKINKDREVVRESIQQLFLTLWKRHRFLSGAESVKAYLLSSLRRLILEEMQRKKARATRNWAYLEKQDDNAFNVEELMIREEITAEKKQILEHVLRQLTPRQKEAVFLRFYHGLTNSEITGVMNINEQCVRNLLSDAIRRLRRHAEHYDYQVSRA